MDNFKSVRKYRNHEFSSGAYTGEDFKAFHRAMNNAIKKELKNLTVHTDKCKHYYWSCFAQNNETGKIVYISISDVRGFDDWYDNVLIRTAKSLTDYTGGANNYCSLDRILEKAESLTR